MRALLIKLQKKEIPIFENTIILRVITGKDGEKGAIGFNLRNFDFIVFVCNVIILAIGGVGQLYCNTDNPLISLVMKYGLALNAGASLIDMEFTQFYPWGFLYPPCLRGALVGCSIIHIC